MAEKYFESGIKTASGFSLAGQSPLDKKYTVATIAERDAHVTENRAYYGMLVFVEEDGKTYQYQKDSDGSSFVWKEFGFNSEDFKGNVYAGLDSDSNDLALAASQGKVLDTKITTHTGNADIHVTTEQKSAWDAKPDTKEDIGLGNVTNDAQVKRSEMGVADGVATLDGSGKIPSAQLPGSVDEIIEAENLEAFPPTGESSKIYVALDTNLTYRWGGSEYVEISKSLALGETSSTAYAGDKGKALATDIAGMKDGTVVVAKANDANTVTGFTVGTNVPSDAKFTDTTYEKATAQADGLMSKEDKNKLDNLSTDDIKVSGAEGTTLTQKLAAPIPATQITEDETHKFVTQEQITKWTTGADIGVATITSNGLMSKEDKIKLDGVEEGANNYVHPDDENTRHVTDVQIAAWNNKAEKTEATSKAAGLMSAADKAKLDHLSTDDVFYKVTNTAGTVTSANSYQITTDNDTIDEINTGISTGSGSLGFNIDEDVVSLGSVEDGVLTINMTDLTTALVRLNCAEVSKVTAPAADGVTYKIKAYGVTGDGSTLTLSEISDAISGTTESVSAIDLTISKTEGEIALAIEATEGTPSTLALTLTPRVSTSEITLTEKLNQNVPASKVTTDDSHMFVTKEEKEAWTAGSTVGNATQNKDGLMSKEDKTKLDGISVKNVVYKDITLLSTDWAEGTNSIDVTIEEFTGDSILNIGPTAGIPSTEYRAMGLANLKSSIKGDKQITITYQGTKPTVDLHISAVIFVK